MINKNNLKNKINITNYIYKITKSMENISILKYKILYKKLFFSNIYKNFFDEIIYDIDIYNDYFLFKNNIVLKNILYVIILTNKGLCGNLNINLYKNIISHIKNNNFLFKNINFIIIGKKYDLLISLLKLNSIKFNILKTYFISNIINKIKKYITYNILIFYKKYKYSKVFIFSNILKKNICKLNIFSILPLININNNNIKKEYIYENNKFFLFKKILFEYINSNIYFYILNNMICEYFNRIFIMKNSSLNSNNLSKKFNLSYNKLRQFNITKEIIEIISFLN